MRMLFRICHAIIWFEIPRSGQAEDMRKNIIRSAIVAAACAPIAALSVVTSATGSAQPPNCPGGQWWDPATNTCKSAVPLACAPGQYWNPLSNLCRPLGQV